MLKFSSHLFSLEQYTQFLCTFNFEMKMNRTIHGVVPFGDELFEILYRGQRRVFQ